MERSFSDRIQAQVQRGKIDSPEAEERAKLEHWISDGVPVPGAPAERIADTLPST